MAMRNAKPRGHFQRGASLVELLIASALGLIAIMLVGSVFIRSQAVATERGKALLLAQNLSTAMAQMKEDMQRAGYDGLTDTYHQLSGASGVIHTQSSPELVGYVYRVASSGASAFRNVVYKREPSSSGTLGHSLKICEKHTPAPLSVSDASDSGLHGNCYNVFDPKQISLTALTVNTETIRGGSTRSQQVNVILRAQLVGDTSVTFDTSSVTLQRNWQ